MVYEPADFIVPQQVVLKVTEFEISGGSPTGMMPFAEFNLQPLNAIAAKPVPRRVASVFLWTCLVDPRTRLAVRDEGVRIVANRSTPR